MLLRVLMLTIYNSEITEAIVYRNGQATTRTYSVPTLVLQLQRPIPLDHFILRVQVATDTIKPTAVVVLLKLHRAEHVQEFVLMTC